MKTLKSPWQHAGLQNQLAERVMYHHMMDCRSTPQVDRLRQAKSSTK